MEALNFTAGDIRDLTRHLKALMSRVPLHAISDEEDYAQAVQVLNGLLDVGGADETSELAPLVDLLGSLIGEYEANSRPLPGSNPQEILRELMNQHELKQGDLPEIGSQGVVSEILNGKRELNARQIGLLARRFGVSPAVFFPEVPLAA